MSEITTGFLKADVYQGAHNDKKRGGVMNTRNNTFPEQQQGFSTADIVWAIGIWSVILSLSPVIVFYVLMVA